MRRWFVLIGSWGCGQDVCELREEADLDCGVVHVVEETKVCKDELDACPRADQRILNDYGVCYRDAGGFECSPTNAQREATLDCLTLLEGLSEDCIIPIGAISL